MQIGQIRQEVVTDKDGEQDKVVYDPLQVVFEGQLI
jgi:hypothetical protein